MTVYRNVLMAFIVSVIVLSVQTPVSAQDKNVIKISGSSNVHDWSCDADIDLRVGNSGTAPSVKGFPDGVTDFKVTIRVNDLICDDDNDRKVSKMEELLRKNLKANKHPDISFEMTGYELKDNGMASVLGKLTIAGESKNVEFNVVLTELSSGAGVQVKGKTEVSMLDYKVKPPSLMFGTIYTYPEVKIEFEVTLCSPAP